MFMIRWLSVGHITRIEHLTSNSLRHDGHLPANQLTCAENTVGWGMVLIELNANEARWPMC
jgi:hypothetical protein